MYSSLVEPRPEERKRVLRSKKFRPGNTNKISRVDAATLAARLQLQEQQRDKAYSYLALTMKLGLLCIGALSLLKLGFASHQRVYRHSELASLLNVESIHLIDLQDRFDKIFTIEGDKRLLDEQDQWIAPNRVRVIWR